MEHYSVTQRRKPTSVAVAWIDLAIVILSQKERDKYDIAYIYIWDLENNDTDELIYTDEHIYKTETDLLK